MLSLQKPRFAIPILQLIFCFPIALAQTCYYPDGSIADSEHSIPGSGSGADTSLCCQEGSIYLNNGLCFIHWDASLNTGSCTDQSWDSPTCFKGCFDSLGRTSYVNTLYRCDDNEWCCSLGGNTTSCCDDGSSTFTLNDGSDGHIEISNATNFVDGFTMVAVSALETATAQQPRNSGKISSTSSPSVDPTQKCANSSTNSVSKPPSNSCTSDNKVVAAGAGAGVGVGVPLLAALAGVLYLLRREKRANRQLLQQVNDTSSRGFDTSYSETGNRQHLIGSEKPQDVQVLHQLPDGEAEPATELESRDRSETQR